MNKSLITNLSASAVIGVSFVTPVGGQLILFTGLFALSGALTNWLAVHMLFERVPLLYGSGVIPLRFREFKDAIHELIMEQFFTAENVERLLESGSDMAEISISPEDLKSAVDYKRVFDRITDAVMESRLGSMLGMFGGKSALSGLEQPVERVLKDVIEDVTSSEDFRAAIARSAGGGDMARSIVAKVDKIVAARLDELTPEDVKRIVQDMIHEHLGWLVVWGGVFGGLIGLLSALVV